ncbi:H(+)/Cl(-) exchange transporter ClcA [Methylobacter sp. S3L5C]|nr:H(+)/Cl(-) exchange transporter ClcA [Methylobacter sp. S3L5C]
MILERQRHRLLVPSILLGLLTGAISVGVNLSLSYGEEFRNRVIDFAHQQVIIGPWIMMGFTVMAVCLSVGLVSRFAPEASGSGISHLKGVMQGCWPFRWLRVLVIKFVSMIIGASAGLMLGRAGPTVHMGGAIGQGLVNSWPNQTFKDRSVLIAAGGGAGLAAAFNSPLAGLVFVLEELDSRCSSFEFFAAGIACLSADMVCRIVLGQYPTFHLVIAGTPPLDILIAFLPLGIVSALLGYLFNRTLLTAQKLISLPLWPRFFWWFVLAAMVTTIGWLTPDLLGGGQDFVNSILEGRVFTLQTIVLFFIIRFIVTIGSSSSGAAGGIFMPVLVLGALLGLGVGSIIQLLFPELNVDAKLFAVVGMASYFTGVVRAPLTGIVLIIEMTGNYTLILPLFVACFSAQIVADWLRVVPIYDALLENTIKKNESRELALSNGIN